MAASRSTYCSLCQDDDETVAACTWCAECETFLCSICEKHHGKNKASKLHKTITIEDYQNLPEFILQTSNRCADHDQKYELYCSFHSTACCIKCMKEKHIECNDLSPLVDVVGNIKSSASNAALQDDLENLQDNFEEIIQYLTNRIAIVQKQGEDGIAKVRQFRQSAKEHLDKLEKEILAKIKVDQDKITSQLQTIIDKVKTQKENAEWMKSDLERMNKFATELQTYTGLVELEKKKDELSEYIKDLNKNESLNDTNLEVNILPALTSFVDEIKSFGNVSTSSTANKLKLKESKALQKHVLSVATPVSVDQIHPTLIKRFKIGNEITISACLILCNGEMLFVDRKHKTLLLFDKNGTYVKEVVRFEFEPYDICHVKDTVVAVSLPSRDCVAFVNVTNNEIVKTVNVQGCCYSIDSDNNQIVVESNKENTVTFLGIDGCFLRRINVPCNYIHRISYMKNNIYCSDFFDNELCHFDKDGVLLHRYQSADIKGPAAIASDNNGLVYVTCRYSNKVVVLSPETTESKAVLSHNDGLDNPIALDIDKNTSTLLVCNLLDGSAFLFKI